MALSDVKDRTNRRPKSASPTLKQPHYMQGILAENFNDIECHAEEWVLPILDTSMLLKRRGSSAVSQHKCMTSSPLVHDIEDYLPHTCHSLSGCTKIGSSAECTERGTPYIPIPKRVRNKGSVNTEIVRRMADGVFEVSSVGTALVKMRKYMPSVYFLRVVGSLSALLPSVG